MQQKIIALQSNVEFQKTTHCELLKNYEILLQGIFANDLLNNQSDKKYLETSLHEVVSASKNDINMKDEIMALQNMLTTEKKCMEKNAYENEKRVGDLLQTIKEMQIALVDNREMEVTCQQLKIENQTLVLSLSVIYNR